MLTSRIRSAVRHVLDAPETGVDATLAARYFEVWLLFFAGLLHHAVPPKSLSQRHLNRHPSCGMRSALCPARGSLRPSCGAKRAAEFAAFLQDEVVADVGHAQWVFTVPKLLRPYFMHHRELLGPLCTAAWQTVRELMAVAAGEEQGLRPGMVAVVQTFGDQLNLHPHVHALVTRGGWTASGEWVPVPYVDPSAAEGPRPGPAK